jgi:hypothetical protein
LKKKGWANTFLILPRFSEKNDSKQPDEKNSVDTPPDFERTCPTTKQMCLVNSLENPHPPEDGFP